MLDLYKWDSSELDECVDFIAEKFNNGFEIGNQLITEFCESRNSVRRISDFTKQLREHLRNNVHKMSQFDTETRAAMLFSLRIPVNKTFAKQLKSHTYLQLSPNDLIKNFVSKNCEFFLGPVGKHGAQWEKLKNFLADYCRNCDQQVSMMELAEGYAAVMGDTEAVLVELAKRFVVMREDIQNLVQFDIPTRIRMMFVTRAPVDLHFLKSIRKNATVQMSKRYITYYKANDGSLVLGKSQAKRKFEFKVVPESPEIEKISIRKRGRKSKNSRKNLIDCLAKICQNSDRPVSISELVKIYIKMSGDTTHMSTVKSRMTHLKAKIHELAQLDINTRVRMLYVTNATVDLGFLETIQKDATIRVSRGQKLIYYKANDGSLELGRDSEDVTSSESFEDVEMDVDYEDGSQKPLEDDVTSSQLNVMDYDVLEPEQIQNLTFDAPEDSDDVPMPILQRENSTSLLIQTVKQEIEDSPIPIREVKKEVQDSEYISESLIQKTLGLLEPKKEKPADIGDFSMANSFGTSSESLESPEETTNHRNFLNILHCLILTLDTPILNGIQEKLEVFMDKIPKGSTRGIALKNVISSLETIFNVVRDSEDIEGDQMSSISIQKILILLMNLVHFLDASQKTSELQMRIKKALEDGNLEKKIPIAILLSALETTLPLIAP